MAEPIWVLPEVLLALHKQHLAEHGGSAGIRDEGLLESALMRPRNRWAYLPDSSIFDIAAAYGYGLAQNHPFVDGNKRTALVAILLFLKLNGYDLSASAEQRYVMMMQVAAGEVEEDELADWLRSWAQT